MNEKEKQGPTHSPLPWSLFEQTHTRIGGPPPLALTGIYDADGKWIENAEQGVRAANAALKVRCVNSHAQLLAACQAALDASLRQWGDGWAPGSEVGGLHEQLRAAIAAALPSAKED